MQYAKLTISVLFALCAFMPSQAEATAYYVDETQGVAAGGDGLATTTAFATLDAFTEAARSAGDIVFVRRVATTTARTVPSDLNFTSDGTIANPIIISADYDNLWSDFATSTQTYTVAIATSTFYASANITGIAAGDWVYVEGDCSETYNSTVLNQCEFAYEVATVSGNALSLYIPYKGNQSGSGLSLRRMPPNPQWNIESGDFQWNFDTDDYWLVKGMDIRGTDSNGQVELDSSVGHLFMDTIFIGNGSGDAAIRGSDDANFYLASKIRTLTNQSIFASAADTWGGRIVKDSFLRNTNTGFAVMFNDQRIAISHMNSYVYDSFSQGLSGAISGGTIGSPGVGTTVHSRNTIFSPAEYGGSSASSAFGSVHIEDYGGEIGKNIYASSAFGGSTNWVVASGVFSDTSLISATSTLRSGGGSSSVEVRPTTNTTSTWDFNKIKLFEYPIYTDTTSRQYDVYFRTATTTAEWTANPTTSELWIQCEYWAHDTNATSTRKVKKSTGTIDFAGSADWQALSVTCQPTQTGIMYLSGFYAKTSEAGQTNYFLVDTTPVITP